jgi:hypothetical protein
MAGIANDLARLRDEISALHVKHMTFVKELKSSVPELLAGFRAAHEEMAQRVKADGVAFVSRLRETVAGLRLGFAADNAAAHLAWFGAGGAGHRAAGRKEAGPGTGAKKARKG